PTAQQPALQLHLPPGQRHLHRLQRPAADRAAPGGLRTQRSAAGREDELLADALAADACVDAARPVHTRRIDRQVVPARTLRSHDLLVAADAADVDRLNDFPSAVAAAEDHFQRAGAGRSFVLRRPPNPEAGRIAGERFGLLVAASSPRSHLMPHYDVSGSGFWIVAAAGQQQGGRDDARGRYRRNHSKASRTTRWRAAVRPSYHRE